jgi:glycosyltransferase involved in cell wall biosynthesis
MKIAWFTPFAKASAIGRFSRLVAERLARAADVDIWHPPADELHETKLRTIELSPRVQFGPGMLAPYDLVVYNHGDHFPYHRDIWLASQVAPGITILHDFVMHHFFADYFLMECHSRQAYLAAMVRLYGNAGRAVTERAFTDVPPPVWETERVVEFPFFEEAIKRAHAVVVHSEFLRRKVENCFPGPVRKLSLAYDSSASRPNVSREDLRIPADRVLIVTVGHVNPNKRITPFIEALGRNPDLCSRVVYAVLGPCEGPYREEIVALIRKYALQDVVRILGYTAEDRLHAYLTHADICANLRFPAMEGGSASVVEEMLYGKPVIVTDNGVYSELPDDCVRKIRPENELEDLIEALRELIGNPAGRQQMGVRARRFAKEEFSADRYVNGFLDLAEELLDLKPLLQVVDRMADRMAQMGVSGDLPIVDTVANECYTLFCGHKARPDPKAAR